MNEKHNRYDGSAPNFGKPQLGFNAVGWEPVRLDPVTLLRRREELGAIEEDHFSVAGKAQRRFNASSGGQGTHTTVDVLVQNKGVVTAKHSFPNITG